MSETSTTPIYDLTALEGHLRHFDAMKTLASDKVKESEHVASRYEKELKDLQRADGREAGVSAAEAAVTKTRLDAARMAYEAVLQEQASNRAELDGLQTTCDSIKKAVTEISDQFRMNVGLGARAIMAADSNSAPNSARSNSGGGGGKSGSLRAFNDALRAIANDLCDIDNMSFFCYQPLADEAPHYTTWESRTLALINAAKEKVTRAHRSVITQLNNIAAAFPDLTHQMDPWAAIAEQASIAFILTVKKSIVKAFEQYQKALEGGNLRELFGINLKLGAQCTLLTAPAVSDFTKLISVVTEAVFKMVADLKLFRDALVQPAPSPSSSNHLLKGTPFSTLLGFEGAMKKSEAAALSPGATNLTLERLLRTEPEISRLAFNIKKACERCDSSLIDAVTEVEMNHQHLWGPALLDMTCEQLESSMMDLETKWITNRSVANAVVLNTFPLQDALLSMVGNQLQKARAKALARKLEDLSSSVTDASVAGCRVKPVASLLPSTRTQPKIRKPAYVEKPESVRNPPILPNRVAAPNTKLPIPGLGDAAQQQSVKPAAEETTPRQQQQQQQPSPRGTDTRPSVAAQQQQPYPGSILQDPSPRPSTTPIGRRPVNTNQQGSGNSTQAQRQLTHSSSSTNAPVTPNPKAASVDRATTVDHSQRTSAENSRRDSNTSPSPRAAAQHNSSQNQQQTASSSGSARHAWESPNAKKPANPDFSQRSEEEPSTEPVRKTPSPTMPADPPPPRNPARPRTINNGSRSNSTSDLAAMEEEPSTSSPKKSAVSEEEQTELQRLLQRERDSMDRLKKMRQQNEKRWEESNKQEQTEYRAEVARNVSNTKSATDSAPRTPTDQTITKPGLRKTPERTATPPSHPPVATQAPRDKDGEYTPVKTRAEIMADERRKERERAEQEKQMQRDREERERKIKEDNERLLKGRKQAEERSAAEQKRAEEELEKRMATELAKREAELQKEREQRDRARREAEAEKAQEEARRKKEDEERERKLRARLDELERHRRAERERFLAEQAQLEGKLAGSRPTSQQNPSSRPPAHPVKGSSSVSSTPEKQASPSSSTTSYPADHLQNSTNRQTVGVTNDRAGSALRKKLALPGQQQQQGTVTPYSISSDRPPSGQGGRVSPNAMPGDSPSRNSSSGHGNTPNSIYQSNQPPSPQRGGFTVPPRLASSAPSGQQGAVGRRGQQQPKLKPVEEEDEDPFPSKPTTLPANQQNPGSGKPPPASNAANKPAAQKPSASADATESQIRTTTQEPPAKANPTPKPTERQQQQPQPTQERPSAVPAPQPKKAPPPPPPQPANSLLQEYRDVCTRMEIKPNSGLLKTLPKEAGKNVSIINLDLNYIGVKGVKPLLEVLQINRGLTLLNLKDNNLENSEVQQLVQVLSGEPGSTLTHLDLSNNPISLAGGSALMDLVTKQKSLTTIVLKGTLIQPKVVEKIVDAARANGESEA